MKRFLVLLLAVVCLVSCKEDSEYMVTVDSAFWGDEFVYNESGLDLTMTLFQTMNGELKTLSLEIANGQSKRLDLPAMEHTLSISMSSDSLKIKFADGKQLVTHPSENLLYGTHEFNEEIRYEGDSKIDQPWPTYTYHITESHYGAAK